mmetsp:Transcript_10788/g.25632  ORF Transcript_10788/g.25632 Transcript_10788/m.25632 type:complete len:241 (+) Transcript_10788:1394-2116(+)
MMALVLNPDMLSSIEVMCRIATETGETPEECVDCPGDAAIAAWTATNCSEAATSITAACWLVTGTPAATARSAIRTPSCSASSSTCACSAAAMTTPRASARSAIQNGLSLGSVNDCSQSLIAENASSHRRSTSLSNWIAISRPSSKELCEGLHGPCPHSSCDLLADAPEPEPFGRCCAEKEAAACPAIQATGSGKKATQRDTNASLLSQLASSPELASSFKLCGVSCTTENGVWETTMVS